MRGFYKKISFSLAAIIWMSAVWAQSTIKGTVTDALSGEPLIGANVVVVGTTNGVATTADGTYVLTNVAADATLRVTMVGYAPLEEKVNGRSVVDFAMQASATELSALEVLASRSTKETPFTFSTVDKQELQKTLGSRDVPQALNATPSVYAVNGGGGAGDSRINVRGFDQKNIAVMINGVPVNDMENGWVYWSNWDGLGDAASSIQMQRGLSAVNLATPSIGGTLNIITDPAAKERGVYVKNEYGSWNFKKTTITANTGLIDGKFAFNATMARKTGDGFFNGTYTDAWSYYMGASYIASTKDRFEFYVIGAPQQHGQNLYKQNIARYNKQYALSLDGYDPKAADKYTEAGWNFNQNYNTVNTQYQGQQYWGMYTNRTGNRHNQDFIMERENFFHKPQVNLNWYHTFSDKLNWATTAYWSGGYGGGSGTMGKVTAKYGPGNFGNYQWDTEIAENSNNIDSAYSTSLNRSTGILRNSHNNQYTIGAISKLYYKVNNNLNITFGIDWRNAKIDHFRTVRDLLGGDYFVNTSNAFATTPAQQMAFLGDKVDYYNTNTVGWFGAYASANYTKNRLSAFGMAGYTNVGYTYTNHFGMDANGKEIYSENKGLGGGQVKGGLLYSLTSNVAAYANAGFVSKNPIFDFAINDGNGQVKDPINEKFTSFEGGLDIHLLDKKMNIKANYYNTTWTDRTKTILLNNNTTGAETFVFVQGINANHSGFEFELAYAPIKAIRIDAAASFGNWVHTGDAKGTFELPGTTSDTTVNFYINGLLVGDAPQNQIMTTLTVKPMSGLSLSAQYRYYGKNYSQWDPTSRTSLENGGRPQSWKVPDYAIVDFHGSYRLPIKSDDFTIDVFAHVFNVMNNFYIIEAVDNSAYNSFDKDHDADDAEVFVGKPRNYNMGIIFRF
ncbi:TonB-dependent receptor [bacterium]|nr:TonB-dependent receptor [bacterium]